MTTPGAVTIYGRYYRAKDGSHRWDSSRVRNTVRVSSINNLQHRAHYVTNPNGWSTYPLDLPPEGWQPSVFAIPTDMPGLRKLASRVFVDKDAQLIAVAASDTTHETTAFEAYRHVNAQGISCVLVPDLNFVPILCQDLMTGKRTAYSNIKLDVDPPASLFEPPPGARIEAEAPPVADHLSHGAGMAQEVVIK